MSNFDGIPRGAYTELEELIKLRLLARELSLTPLLRPRSSTSGIRQSSHRGRGVDFEEVRIYQPGDDVRSIDWRVTARTSKVHTKVFREEKERPVFILVDQRRPMFFGSRRCCKSVQAAWLAALIAWISLQRADQVGGLVLGEDALNEIRPRRSHHTVLRMLQEIHRQNRFLERALEQTQAHDICRALSDLRRTMHPGSLLFIISDCSDLLGEATVHLHHLARHCEVCVLRVSDVLERQLPAAGGHLYTDGKQRLNLHSSTAICRRFAAERERQLGELQDMLNNLRVALREVDTADTPAELFRHHTATRAA